MASPHFRERRLFDARLTSGSGVDIPALPLPIARGFIQDSLGQIPPLGEADATFLAKQS